ncbi:uncharacterized protein LOC143981554 [Lithobates pipiens]
MSLLRTVSLILSLQLVWGNTVADNETINSTDALNISGSIYVTPGHTVPDGQATSLEKKEWTTQMSNERQCAWWCDETLGIAIAAGLGAIFLISVILCAVSCCLWKRRRTHPVMKEMELEALTQNLTAECSVTLPGDSGKSEPLTTNDNGICDLENCTSEATQDAQDMDNNFPPPENNLPEFPDVPPLVE